MRIAVAGTSNSLMRDGYTQGLKDHSAVSTLDNFSTGGSSSVLLFRVAEDYSLSGYDFVVLDFAPNEDFFYSSGRSSEAEMKDRLTDFIATHLSPTTVPVIAILPIVPGLSESRAVHAFLRSFAEEHGYPLYDGYTFARSAAQALSTKADHLFADRDHLHREVAYQFGKLIGDGLARIHQSPPTRSTTSRMASSFQFRRLSPDDGVAGIAHVERRTSALGARFYRLEDGQKLHVEVERPQTIVGVGINVAQCSGRLVISSENELRSLPLTHPNFYSPQRKDEVKSLTYMLRPMKEISGRDFTLSTGKKDGEDGIIEVSGLVLRREPRAVEVPIFEFDASIREPTLVLSDTAIEIIRPIVEKAAKSRDEASAEALSVQAPPVASTARRRDRKASDPIQILILGTSNSILKRGWVAGLREAMPDAKINNKSIGGSPGIQYATLMGMDFSPFDYVFFDSIPNDEIYEEFLGEKSFADRVLFEILSTISTQSNLIIIGFCLDVNLRKASEVYARRRFLAHACGAQFVGMRDLVLRYGRSIIGEAEELYETDAHPKQAIQRLFGFHIGREITKAGYSFPFNGYSQNYSNNFAAIDPTINPSSGTVQELRNSLLSVKVLELRENDSVVFPNENLCLGFYLNKFNTRAFVFLEGSTTRRAKEFWYDIAKDKFEMRFIPIFSGAPTARITVAGAELPFERSAYTGFSNWPTEGRHAILSLGTVAFWSGNRDEPVPAPQWEDLSLELHDSVDRAVSAALGVEADAIVLTDRPVSAEEVSARRVLSLLKDGKLGEAADAAAPLTGDVQHTALTRYALGQFALQQRKTREAENHFQEGLRLNPNHREIRRAYATLCSDQKRHSEAVDHLQNTVSKIQDPGDLQRLGQALLKSGQVEDALGPLLRSIETRPNALSHNLLGSALMRQGRLVEAYEHYQQALQLEPNRLPALREGGLALMRMKRPQEAINHFSRLVELAPKEERGYLGLGRAQAAVGEIAAAAETFLSGLKVCGEDIDLLIELARLRARAGDRVAAKELFGRVLAVQPDHLYASLEFIRQAMTARQFAPAKEAADQLIKRHPDDPDVLFEFGRVCLETGQPERARQSFEQSLAKRPAYHPAHYRLSQLELRNNDVPAALVYLSRAVELEPKRVNYRIDRARLHLALNQFDLARQDAEAALGVEPKNLKASQIVALVREMSDDVPDAHVALCFHAAEKELPALRAALSSVPEAHEAWVATPDGAEGERILPCGRDEVEPLLTEASEAPWMAVAPASAAPALLALLAEPQINASLRGIETMHGRVVFTDASGLPRLTVMRRELLHFFSDMAQIERQPVHALIEAHEEMLRTVTVDPQGQVHRLPAPGAMRDGGKDKVFLISRHGFELYGGGEQFLRGMAHVYRGEGFEPIIIGMRSDVPGAVEGQEGEQRFAQLRPFPGDIFTYALKRRPRVVQVLSGLGYEVLTPLKYLHMTTVYGTHFWRDMFEEIGGYLNIDQNAVPKREFNAILKQATVVYSNSHYTAEMKRRHFGVSTPLVYSLTADTDVEPVTSGEYALLVNARPEKGFDLILEVAKRVPHVRFLVLASQSPVAQAEEEVARAGVTNITVAGKVSDMMEAYAKAKVVLVPSYAFIETFSRVVIEAHRLGLPVVGSDRGNVPYLLTESGSALPEDADAWAAELDRLFTDPAYYRRRTELALENSARYAFAGQPERIRRIIRFGEKRILVAVGAGLGNIVQTSPLIRRLAEHYGRPVDVVVKEDFKGCSVLVAGSPYVNMVFPLDRNVLHREYDLVYVTHSFGDIIPSFNANEVIAARRHFVFQMTKEIHEAEFNLFCAGKLLGLPYEKADAAKYFVANASRSAIPNGIIGIHSGGKGGEWEEGSWLNKRWPYYKDLVAALQQRGYQVASFGVASEYVEGTIDLTGTPLMESVRNIAQCSYFIGNDSGLMHIADALGVPLTTIFGPTSVVKNGPLSPTSSVIELKKDCAPCQFDERFATCTCIAAVGLVPVLDHVLMHMDKATGPDGEKAYVQLENVPVTVG